MTTINAIKKIIAIGIGVKVIYFLIAFFIANFTELPLYEKPIFKFEGEKAIDFLNILRRNDAGWYEKIAISGHQKVTPIDLAPNEIKGYQQSYYGFFPLYPYLIRGMMAITGNYTVDHFVEISFLFSIVISLSCFICFFYFANDYFQNVQKAFESTLLLIIFPFHYYFSAFLTEAFFLLLVLICFIAINKKFYLVLCITACLVVLTRPNGILMGIPLALWYGERNNWKLERKDYFRIAAFLSAMFFTLISYCIYLKFMTGDFTAFSTAQKGWGRHLSSPITTLFSVTEQKDIILSAYTILFIAITILSYKKLGISFFVLVSLGILVPISYAIVGSMTRYIIVLFPFMLVFTSYIFPLSLSKRIFIYSLLFIFHIGTFLTWLFAFDISS